MRAILVITVVPRRATVAPAVVMMQYLRGPEAATKVAAGKPALLVFDVAQATADQYRVRILDLVGKEVLSTRAGSTNGRVSVLVKNLSRGSYWVRLYRNENSQLSAEYALRAE